MKHKIIAILSLSVLSCAGNAPVIDTKGIDMSNYKVELSECTQYAEQISMGEEAAIGAGLGAAFAWAVSAVAGGDTDTSAAVGAVTGGAAGMGDAAQEKSTIIKNCLRGRGYRVLN